MTQEYLLDMELHQETEVHELLSILRVPGGWIYKFHERRQSGIDDYTTFTLVSTTFVPELT